MRADIEQNGKGAVRLCMNTIVHKKLLKTGNS